MRTKLLPYCLTLCDPWTGSPTRLLCSWDSPGNKTGVGCHSLFQRIFPTRQDPSLLCLLFWQACSLPLAPPGNKQMLSNNRHSITLRILGVRTRLSFGDTSIHSHKKNGKSSPTAVFDSIFFYETLCKFSVWPWLQGTDFQKQMWRLLLISWWKKENSIPFTSLYMFRNVRRKKKKKRNCWKANYGSLCPIFLLHICCFQPCSFSELLLCCHSDNEPHCISSIFPPLPATNVTSICTCPWSILLSTSPSHPSTGHLPVSLTGWWA